MKAYASHEPEQHVMPPVEADAFAWVQLWMPFLLLVVPLWIGYKSLKLRTDAANKERQKKWEEEHNSDEDDDAPSDRTVLQHVRTLMKEKK